MTISATTALKNARLDAITAAAGAGALLNIYAGTKPATANSALSSNPLLAQLAMSNPIAPAASGGVLTMNAITQDSSADATGVATFFRVTTSGGTVLFQGDVGTGGQDLNLNTTSLTVGGPVAVTSFTATEGN